MFPIIEDPSRKDKIKDYIDYLDRTRRTTGKSRYETHLAKLSKETARYYGLTEKEILSLDDILKNEKLNNEEKELENHEQEEVSAIEAPRFEWGSTEDPEIYRYGKRFLIVAGRSKAIQHFVEVISYKIGHKCDFSFTAGRAHIDVLKEGYEKAVEAVNDSEFMSQFIVPYSKESYDDETYFEILGGMYAV